MIEGGVLSYLLIASAALVASALTLFSGFGLGTLLMPAFALFFPIEVAVALTAVVLFLDFLFLCLGLAPLGLGPIGLLFCSIPGVLALMLAVVSAIDSYMLAERVNRGETLGDWETFTSARK